MKLWLSLLLFVKSEHAFCHDLTKSRRDNHTTVHLQVATTNYVVSVHVVDVRVGNSTRGDALEILGLRVSNCIRNKRHVRFTWKCKHHWSVWG